MNGVKIMEQIMTFAHGNNIFIYCSKTSQNFLHKLVVLSFLNKIIQKYLFLDNKDELKQIYWTTCKIIEMYLSK
jgi:hypothetical protein